MPTALSSAHCEQLNRPGMAADLPCRCSRAGRARPEGLARPRRPARPSSRPSRPRREGRARHHPRPCLQCSAALSQTAPAGGLTLVGDRLCAHRRTAVTRGLSLPLPSQAAAVVLTPPVSLHGTPTAPVFHHARLTAIEQSAPLVRPHLPVALDVVPTATLCCIVQRGAPGFPSLPGLPASPVLPGLPSCPAARTNGSTVRNANALPQQTPPWHKPLCVAAVVFAKADSIRSALTRDAVVAGRAVGTGRPGCAVLAGCTTRPRPARTAIETVRAVGTGRAVGAGRARHAGLSHESRTRVVRRVEPIGPCSNQRASE